MNTDSELVEGELVVYNDSTPAPSTLFGTADPERALARMAEIATVLVDVIKDRKLFARISGKEHVTAEGWTTLGGMLGVVPVVAWTRPLEDGTGWEARVEARTLDGRIVGAAESMCSRSERTWARRDEFALRSMAQTRAIARALRAPLGQVVALAGFQPASAEEIDHDDAPAPIVDGPIPAPIRPTPEQKDELRALISTLEAADPDTDWRERCREIVGVPNDLLTETIAASLIYELQQHLAELAERGNPDQAASAQQEGERP